MEARFQPRIRSGLASLASRYGINGLMNPRQIKLLEKRTVFIIKGKLLKSWGMSRNGVSHADIAAICCKKAGWHLGNLNKRAILRLIIRYWDTFIKEPIEISEKAKIKLKNLGLRKVKRPILERIPLGSEQQKTSDDLFFSSREWRELRYKAFKLHGAACQCCGATAKSSGNALHCDHVKPRHTHPELEWDLGNLQILCQDCNLGKGAWDQTDWRIPTESFDEQPNLDLDAEYHRRMN